MLVDHPDYDEKPSLQTPSVMLGYTGAILRGTPAPAWLPTTGDERMDVKEIGEPEAY